MHGAICVDRVSFSREIETFADRLRQRKPIIHMAQSRCRISAENMRIVAPSGRFRGGDGISDISPKRIDYGSNVRRSKRDVDPHTKHGLFSALASDAGLPPGEPTPKDPWASYGRPEPVTPRYEQLPTPPPIIGKIAESGTPEPRPASPEPWSSSRPTMPPPGVATPEDFGLKSGGGQMITQDQLDRLGVSNRKSMDFSPFLPGWKLIYSKLGDRWAVSCHAIDK